MQQKSLNKIFRSPQMILKSMLEEKLRKKYNKVINEDGFLYAEGTLPVMLVAHLDTVHHEAPSIICYSQDGRYVMSPQGIGGDDRCGVIAILSILQETDLRPHILFCEDEETGGIGASKFCKTIASVNANYIIEIDRKGDNDCVFYSCDNEDFTKFVEGFGFKTAWGSFSDISELAPHLGIAAVNLSSGYYNPHTNYEYVDLVALRKVIDRIVKMLKTETSKFDYIEKVYTPSELVQYYKDYYKTALSSYGGYGSYYSSRYYDHYDDKDDDDYYKTQIAKRTAKQKKKKKEEAKTDEVALCPYCRTALEPWSEYTNACYECGRFFDAETGSEIFTYSK